jgi:hypothetical protein
MFWFFTIIVAAVLGAVITAGVLAPNKNFAVRVIGVILALALLVIGIVFLWKHAIVALAIAAVCSLAVGVMFQKVDPSKAIGGALAAFVLMFVFSWLALQMADPLLFGRDSDLSRWINNYTSSFRLFDGHDVGGARFLTALGVASLLTACFLDRWMKAIAVFFGALLLLFFAPSVLEQQGLFDRDFFYGNDPVFKLAILCVIVIGIVGIARLLTNTKNSKHP